MSPAMWHEIVIVGGGGGGGGGGGEASHNIHEIERRVGLRLELKSVQYWQDQPS